MLQTYKGFEYIVEDDVDYDVVKKWHYAYDTATDRSYDLRWSPYSYLPREEFERQVDQIIDRMVHS